MPAYGMAKPKAKAAKYTGGGAQAPPPAQPPATPHPWYQMSPAQQAQAIATLTSAGHSGPAGATPTPTPSPGATPKPPAGGAAKPAPVAKPSTGPTYKPAPRPFDAQSLQEKNNAFLELGNTQLDLQEEARRTRVAYGLDDASDPFSKARMLVRNYQQRQQGTINSSGNQFYAGSTNRALGEGQYQYTKDEAGLRGEYNEALAGNVKRGNEAGNRFRDSVASADAGALERYVPPTDADPIPGANDIGPAGPPAAGAKAPKPGSSAWANKIAPHSSVNVRAMLSLHEGILGDKNLSTRKQRTDQAYRTFAAMSPAEQDEYIRLIKAQKPPKAVSGKAQKTSHKEKHKPKKRSGGARAPGKG